ncbi:MULTISPECIES: hypothetical protein [Roseobacteraceae]|uniref:Uncharacterized protein n=2 Tax=Alloyangia TaxID=2919626 RepID=A0A1I6WH68_9RHOB|nr:MULTISPECIES: hypothetical protein [Alloyangia]MCT4372036.1 hypothetical protein [Alloyangia mangrovi]NDW60164.1 hypothetical protein [Salipiger sp. PrR004]SDI73796.1 hypothetical protein SAMN04488245_1246 [Alloyangia pacifica]SFT25101.1 hypothetical protein SAMN04488050_1216 [Alloyangia pacifica]
MKILHAAFLPLLAAGCASVAELDASPTLVAATNSGMTALAEAGPTVTYTRHAIEEPGDWRALNDAQSEESR